MSIRKTIRAMQREKQRKADKDAAKSLGWSKALRQYSKRLGQGAEYALALSKQVERNNNGN